MKRFYILEVDTTKLKHEIIQSDLVNFVNNITLGKVVKEASFRYELPSKRLALLEEALIEEEGVIDRIIYMREDIDNFFKALTRIRNTKK